MDNQELIEQVTGFCEAAFIEVFQNQNCLVYRTEEDNQIPYFENVVIDAISDELRLLLVLSLPRPVLVASYPMQDEVKTIVESKINDWYMELANRLLGSLKNRVVRGTSPMQLGIPRVVRSTEASSMFTQEMTRVPLFFEYDGVAMECVLGIEVCGKIASLEQDEIDCMDGELEFF